MSETSTAAIMTELRGFQAEKFAYAGPLENASTPDKVLEWQKTEILEPTVGFLAQLVLERVERDLEKDIAERANSKQLPVDHETLRKLIVGDEILDHLRLSRSEKDRISKLETVVHPTEAVALMTKDSKENELMERKTRIFRHNTEIRLRRMIDRGIWGYLLRRFELDQAGLLFADNDAEINKGFLGTFEGAMFDFLLGVGWNQKLVDIYDTRRQWVDEMRDIVSMRLFNQHYSDLSPSEDPQKIMVIKNFFKEIEESRDGENVKTEINLMGNSEELMRKIRQVSGIEVDVIIPPEDEDLKEATNRAYGLAREYGLNETPKISTWTGFEAEEVNQLNRRSQKLFGTDFLSLTKEEQLMLVAGTDEILSDHEIMFWLGGYQVPQPGRENVVRRIRLLEVPYTHLWKHFGWVEELGPWRAAEDMQSMIMAFSAKSDQLLLQRQQVEGNRANGFGRFRYFCWEYFEAMYGGGGIGKLKKLFAGEKGEVEWMGGFWEEMDGFLEETYDNYKIRMRHINLEHIKYNEPEEDLDDLETFKKGYLRMPTYKHLAKEWFISGWRRVAEGVHIKKRGDMLELAARRGMEEAKAEEILEQDRMSLSIGLSGKKHLMDMFLREKRAHTLLSAGWRVVSNLFVFGAREEEAKKERDDAIEIIGMKAVQFLYHDVKIPVLDAKISLGQIILFPSLVGLSIATGFGPLVGIGAGYFAWKGVSLVKDKFMLSLKGWQRRAEEDLSEMNRKFDALSDVELRKINEQLWVENKSNIIGLWNKKTGSVYGSEEQVKKII